MIELLALLEGKAGSLELSQKSYTQISREDILTALAFADKEYPGVSYLLRYKYLDQDYYWHIVKDLILKIRESNDWKTDYYRKELIFDSAKLSVDEFCKNNLCMLCGGDGQWISSDTGEVFVCAGCKGRKYTSMNDHAERLGLTHYEWKDWEYRVYRPMLSELHGLEDNGCDEMARCLYG
jgi:hypothetical protein